MIKFIINQAKAGISRISRLSSVFGYGFCVSSPQSLTYEERKKAKQSQQQQDMFSVDISALIQTQLNAEFLVPNFFTSSLPQKTYPTLRTQNKKVNHFLNSYSSLVLRLSSNLRLRQKLNKINDEEVRIGRIFQIMDSVAGLVSYRHCFAEIEGKQKNPMACVTGSIESFYLFEKIDIKKDLSISGYLNTVGRTSMQIQIRIDQDQRLKASSLFTMIARDATNLAKGWAVPALDFSSLNEIQRVKAVRRQKLAKENALIRKKQLENSYDKTAPSQIEIKQLHQIFLQRKDNLRLNSMPIGLTKVQNSEIMHTQERNVHGKIFGGFLIRQMVEIGWVSACKFAQDYVIMEDLTNIYFKKPVDVGCRLTLRAIITYVENKRVVITVQAYTAKFTDKKQTLACTLNIIAKASKILPAVHPQSYQEGLLYLSSKKAYTDLFY